MTSSSPVKSTRRGTVFGGIAILLWSTTVAFSRSLTEQLGTFTAAALIYTAAGVLGLLIASLRTGELQKINKLPRLYLVGCGTLFVIYIICLYLALGMAENRAQVLAVGLINYLWPALSLAFSIPLLKKRAGPLLVLGIVLALTGIWLATTGPNLQVDNLYQEPKALIPYGLALTAAVSWALYSNLSRRWAAGDDGGGVPLFLFASGLILWLMRIPTNEISVWSWKANLELAYMAVFPGMIAYVLWDYSVRKGEIILVASLSYLTPLFSTLISSLVLDVRPATEIWIAAGLIIAGALICKTSIYPDKQADSA